MAGPDKPKPPWSAMDGSGVQGRSDLVSPKPARKATRIHAGAEPSLPRHDGRPLRQSRAGVDPGPRAPEQCAGPDGGYPGRPASIHRRSMGTLPMPGRRRCGAVGFQATRGPVRLACSLRPGLPFPAAQPVGDPRMAGIAGVNLPAQKHVWVGLESISGLGRTRSKLVCEAAGVASNTTIRDLSEPEVERLRAE